METERLIIDKILPSDKEEYFKNISHDKKVLETFICKYAEKIEDLDITPYLDNDAMFAIRLKTSEKLIGIILYFDENELSCEIGYGIGSAYWNNGYATEAVSRFIRYCFEEKGFSTVYASFFTGNVASERVMKKCNMTFYRLSEKELTYLDKERDLIYYSIDNPNVKDKKPAYNPVNGTFSKAGGEIVAFDADRIGDVLSFERRLREEEDVWGWDIDDAYVKSVRDSFSDGRFDHSISLIAYWGGKVVGRIDSTMIATRFDGSVKAYLDWICVLKSYRHKGVGQALMKDLCGRLKEKGIDTLIALTASNDEAQSFYKAIPNSLMRDVGIWIEIK